MYVPLLPVSVAPVTLIWPGGRVGTGRLSGDEAAQEPRGKRGRNAAKAMEKGAREDARHPPEEV